MTIFIKKGKHTPMNATMLFIKMQLFIIKVCAKTVGGCCCLRQDIPPPPSRRKRCFFYDACCETSMDNLKTKCVSFLQNYCFYSYINAGGLN